MTEPRYDRFLFIGTTNTEAAVSKLKASGIHYVQKRLESGLENWAEIRSLVEESSVRGVIAKITAQNYSLMASSPKFTAAARVLFQSLAHKPHIVFVHEAVLNNEPPLSEEEAIARYGDTHYNYLVGKSRSVAEPAVVAKINSILDGYALNLVPYRTNAELSVLTSSFIDDNERNLLFRVYVPSGRLYATEADKLLALFRDWLGQIGQRAVRQDGYATASGKVYEFFGDESVAAKSLSVQFDEFSLFLDRCVGDPEDARAMLEELGVPRNASAALVQRYGKEAQRLQLDLRQERENRILAIKHKLESDVLEQAVGTSGDQVGQLVEAMVPIISPTGRSTLLGAMNVASPPQSITLNINNQTIQAVKATVAQSIQGTVHLGAEASELLALVKEFGGSQVDSLESDIYELEDADARPPERLGARQRLKGFLLKLGGHIEDAALGALQGYLEGKLSGML